MPRVVQTHPDQPVEVADVHLDEEFDPEGPHVHLFEEGLEGRCTGVWDHEPQDPRRVHPSRALSQS